MQVNNFGSINTQNNIDNSVTFPQADVQFGVTRLRELIAAGAIPENIGEEIVVEVEESLSEANGQPTGRLKNVLQRMRDMLAIGGASADDVAKVASAITAISSVIGG